MLFCFIKSTYRHSFLNIGPFFYYFHPFLILTTNAVSFSAISIEKSIDSVLGIRTCGRWIVCAVETTEPWRPPSLPPTYIVDVTIAEMEEHPIVPFCKWPKWCKNNRLNLCFKCNHKRERFLKATKFLMNTHISLFKLHFIYKAIKIYHFVYIEDTYFLCLLPR